MSLPSWLRPLATLLGRTPARMKPASRFGAFRPGLESLEDRCVPATFLVTNCLDDGLGSLRQAITSADNNPAATGQNLIQFAILKTQADGTPMPGYRAATDSFQIQPLTPLPGVVNTVIDGYSQAGARQNTLRGAEVTGTPADPSQYGDDAVLKIELSGDLLPASYRDSSGGWGISVTNGTVQGLCINQWFRCVQTGGTGDVVQGNFIGTDVTGEKTFPHTYGDYTTQGNGVEVWSNDTLVGGTTPAARNVISGFGFAGVIVVLPGLTGTVVQGNFIGTDAHGTKALGSYFGVDGFYGQPLLVGGTTPGASNLISGNVYGIEEWGGAGAAQIQGNLIGTDVTGNAIIGNSQAGIVLHGSGSVVGGTDPAARNVISGNSGGVLIYGESNSVEGNYIGTDKAGRFAVGNEYGVFIGGGSNNHVGGSVPGSGNLISGNGNGVYVTGGSDTFIEGNAFGTDADGNRGKMEGLGNYNSVTVVNHGSITGGVITNNTMAYGGYGISINDPPTVVSSIVVSSNRIHDNNAGVFGYGVGGGFTFIDNSIYNNGTGIQVGNTPSHGGAVFQHNAIYGNGWGVMLDQGNTLGGTTPGVGNDVYGNHGIGVYVGGAGNAILGNSIHDNEGFGIYGSASDRPAPVLNPVVTTGNGTATFTGSLATQAGKWVRLEFFANQALNPNGQGEGRTFLGYWEGTVPADGRFTATVTLKTSLPPNEPYLTATATDGANSTSMFSVPVQVYPTHTALTASANPAVYGQAVTLTAAVSGSDTPTGSVDFVDTTTGTDLGTIPLSGGTASVTTSALGVGGHVITATFLGTGNYLGSSDTLTETISPATPVVTVTDAGGTYNSHAFAATATVAGGNGVVGATLEGVGLTLDYQQLDANGHVIADFGAAAPIAAGTYRVVASFAGSADYSSASASTVFTIARATPTFGAVGTTVITDGTPSVTLSGTISYGSLVPTGSVTVTVDGVSQSATISSVNGTFSATFATGSLSVGTHSVSFSYGGDANFTAASAGGTLDDTYAIVALFDQTHAKHPGSTLPVKIALGNAAGKNVSSGGVAVTALGIAATTDTKDAVGSADPASLGTLIPAAAAGGSNPGNAFRYQGGANPFYAYDLKIPDNLTPGTYRLYFSVAGDPLVHWVTFTVG